MKRFTENRRKLEARQSTRDLLKGIQLSPVQSKQKSASTSTCERHKSLCDNEQLKPPVVTRCEFKKTRIWY